ncbi:Diphthamide synthase, putative [Leishmania lindenbergi]|uniref:Diphthine--ammonia ligase n=1 Tax=Leishmania lindenbergi TaxID=651832 RepID=A0AAW3AAH1_9TRYP
MKTIALLSGGKDSILAMLMAYRYGHEAAVVVNMVPVLESEGASRGAAENGVHGHDIDSYMYQTVGFEAVEAIAACLGIPLRRGCVKRGRAKDQSLLYSEKPSEEDEVESLYRLIKTVKEEFPVVQGLTSGAILSNYQRNRVEFICDRLGLESLAYLWMRQPGEILDMAHALHVQAILVKTASIGLMPRQLIGKTLEEARPTLEKMAELYQSHLAGEGGEYETTVLNCPLFYTEQVAVTSLEVVMQDTNDISPSGHGVLTVARVPKSAEEQAQSVETLAHLRAGYFAFPSDVMPLLRNLSASPRALNATASMCSSGEITAATLPATIRSALFLGTGIAAARDAIAHHTYAAPHEAGVSAAEALEACLTALETWAAERGHTPFYYHFSLPEPSWEVVCRAAYAAKVSHVCPPGLLVTVRSTYSRATAALEAEVLAAPTETIQQQVLHAQSRSCWALGEPGPHSQARRVCLATGASRLFVSATPGRIAATREVATVADLPAACHQHVAALVTTQHVEDRTALPDTVAQFLVAMAHCERYLSLFGSMFGDVCRATIIVTEDVPVALLPALWQWSTQHTGTLPFERVVQVVVVGGLSGTEKIRVSMECVEVREAVEESP